MRISIDSLCEQQSIRVSEQMHQLRAAAISFYFGCSQLYNVIEVDIGMFKISDAEGAGELIRFYGSVIASQDLSATSV